MPKRKRRAAPKKKQDDSPDDISECESLDSRQPSAKKVAAASSTSHIDDEVDHIPSFSTVSLHATSKSESGEKTALLLCNYCKFSADTRAILGAHMHQHMINCPHCSFSSLSRIEVSRHCKYEHEKDLEEVSQEVDSSSTDCEMDKDPCSACVFCSFMTYSTEHLEKHTAHKHPGMLAKSVAKMVTKQISAEVRKDDYLFYLVMSNEGPAKSSTVPGLGSCAAEKSSGTIVIDATLDKTEDVKPEVKCSSDTKYAQYRAQEMGQFLESAKLHVVTHPDSLTVGENIGSMDSLTKVETSSTLSVPVKVETMYCLTCPYSNVYIEKLKCHTIVQHPVGAAAATYNSTGEILDAQEITFFCVREDCNHSSSDCSTYQKHLMDCCACQKTLKVIERERLKSTITYILEHQRKHKLLSEEGFFDFATHFLGLSLPSLKGTPSSRGVEISPGHQAKSESPQSSVANTAQTFSESSSLSTGLNYNTQSSQITSASLNVASSSESAGSYPSDISRSFFPQQLQNMTSNNHSAAGPNSGNYQRQIFNLQANMPVQLSSNSTNMPPDGSPQSNHNTQTTAAFLPHQRGFQQPSPTMLRNYQETPQFNVGWPSSHETEATKLAPVSVQQSQQNFKMPLQNQLQEVSAGLLPQDSGASHSPVNQNKLDSFSFVQNAEGNQNFISMPVHNNYAPTSRQVSLDSANSNVNANMTHNLVVEHDEASTISVSNPMTNLALYGQQPGNNGLNTTNVAITRVETQPQPKMLDLLSDSYSILLSDEFESEGHIPELGVNNPIQQKEIPQCPPSYHRGTAFNTQSQAVISQTASLMCHNHSAAYPPNQQEVSNFEQTIVDNSPMHNCENQLSYPPSNHGNQIANVVVNLAPDSGFQTTQNLSSYGALRSALTPEAAPCVNQSVPLRAPNVPNFLVAPGVPSLEAAPVQQQVTSSFLNPHPNIAQPSMPQSAPFTPPKNPKTVNRFVGTSPLSPSIYLCGQSPRHRRSNWTDADMRPRGMMSHAVPPRMSPGVVASPPSQVNQRLFSPVRRGYPRPPRMMPGRGRMPAPRLLNHRVGGEDDDDDVIVTAVTRVPSAANRQPHQQSDGRFPSHGTPSSVSRGRGQPSPIQNRQRSPFSGVRVPYPVPPPPPQPQKQFDISKHFEDLACVVNATVEEGDVGNDDIEIVCVTPGDKEKSGHARAVDASKFSFCCVHCGKDQGSKNVMKQHMKARHNDSLLGAFTNTETGQLLFFCPQLTCEFMTYDEKRLCEHLSKCFDLDRSKPFDFGTAIKNLKSLKIRQLDVRTMGRSQNNPIDLDGQGMKDNFSSSLNDAFGDIVVSASGRHIMRNSTPPYQTPPPQARPQSIPIHNATTQVKAPLRSQAPYGTGARLPGFRERVGMANRMLGPITTIRPPRQQHPEMRGSTRLTAPTNMRTDVQNVRDMYPKVPASGGHQQSTLRGAPPPHVDTPTRPPNGGGEHDPVIVIDVDSPERPEANEQTDSVLNDSPEFPYQMSESMPDGTNSERVLSKSVHRIMHFPAAINTNASHEQLAMSCKQDLYSHAFPASQQFNPPDSSSSLDSMADMVTTTIQSSTASNEPIHYSDNTITGNVHYDSEPLSSDAQLLHNSVSVSHNVSCTTSDSSSFSFFHKDRHLSVAAALDTSVSTHSNLPSDISKPGTSCATVPTYTVAESSVADSQITQCSSGSSNISTTSLSSSSPSTASLPHPHNITRSSTVFTMEYFAEEERVNAIVLEKVFAKVPNMPKNLSRRLVDKFKEYAHDRGVKITSDSKVIDEFVSKIYYKGSVADKNTCKSQPAPYSLPAPPAANSEMQNPDADSEVQNPDADSEVQNPDADSEVQNPDADSEVQNSDADSEVQTPDADSENLQIANSAASTVPALSGSSLLSCENSATNEETEGQCDSSRELNDVHNIESAQEDVTSKGNVEEQQTVVGEDCAQQTPANDVIATKVILPQTSLQFTPTFARIALKSLAASTKILETRQGLKLGLQKLKPSIVSEQNLMSPSFESGIARDYTAVLTRRNSANDNRMPKLVYPIRRSSSLPLNESSGPDFLETVQPLDKNGIAELNTVVPSSHSVVTTSISVVTTSINVDLDKEASLVSPEVCMPSSETPPENLALINKDTSKEELQVSFLHSPQSDVAPILVTSSVEDVVSRHPALEVDIAGKPLTQDQLNEGNRELDIGDNITDSHTDVVGDDDQILSNKEQTILEKVTAKYSGFIDKTTGKLLLKKTKRGRPRKLLGDREEKRDDIKDTFSEEHVVRRSSRSRKPVNKDYQNDVNEIDEDFSDDDDEYNIDEDDYGTDTDNEWHKGNADQPPRKKIKKIVAPPDPTAFNVSTKGKFKCWLCKKIFSRCTFAKSHIVQKHDAGLCAIYLDKSEETKSLCLLLFCPRKCKYVTLSSEGIKNHVENCIEPLLGDNGDKYLEISKQFLNSTCSELQKMSLEEILNKTKARKPKNPADTLKAKKSKLDKSAAVTETTSASDASVVKEVGSVIIPPAAPSSLCAVSSSAEPAAPLNLRAVSSSAEPAAPLSLRAVSGSATIVTKAVVHHSAYYDSAELPDLKPKQMPHSLSCATIKDQERSTVSNTALFHPQDQERSTVSKTALFHPQSHQHIGSQLPPHQATAGAPKVTSPHYTHIKSNFSSAPRAHTSFADPLGHFSTGDKTQTDDAFSQPADLSNAPSTVSPTRDGEIAYVVEDNGTICLN